MSDDESDEEVFLYQCLQCPNIGLLTEEGRDAHRRMHAGREDMGAPRDGQEFQGQQRRGLDAEPELVGYHTDSATIELPVPFLNGATVSISISATVRQGGNVAVTAPVVNGDRLNPRAQNERRRARRGGPYPAQDPGARGPPNYPGRNP